ncbi:unnamed protein product, partial [marine sediment metagenome]
PAVCFVLTQSPKKFGIGGGEPAEVCGGAGERHFSEADNDGPASLALGWNDGNLFYALSGTLNGPLTEEVLHQIACSVGAD